MVEICIENMPLLCICKKCILKKYFHWCFTYVMLEVKNREKCPQMCVCAAFVKLWIVGQIKSVTNLDLMPTLIGIEIPSSRPSSK